MTKNLTYALSALAIVLTLSGAAFAETGYQYTPADQGTSRAETTWVYSSLCKAAVPVPPAERQEVSGPYMGMSKAPVNMQMPVQGAPDEGHPITGVAAF